MIALCMRIYLGEKYFKKYLGDLVLVGDVSIDVSSVQ